MNAVVPDGSGDPTRPAAPVNIDEDQRWVEENGSKKIRT
jgi:hypothetical protein